MSEYFQHHDHESWSDNFWRADAIFDALSADDRARVDAALDETLDWLEHTGGCAVGYYLDRVALVRRAVGDDAFNAAQREAWRREAINAELDAEMDMVLREREEFDAAITRVLAGEN